MSEARTQSSAQEISCQECRELLSDYVDRELLDGEKASVEQHLGACEKCGSESARLHGLKKVVQHWDGLKSSGEFRKSLMDKVVRESQLVTHQVAAPAIGAAQTDLTDEDEPRSWPPVWILLVAVALALASYYLVIYLRGG